MTNPSQNKKKKKRTITASKEGLETAGKALLRLGFESNSKFAESQLLSRSTVSNFFNQHPIQLDSFKRICEALKLDWKEIAGITEESITSSQQERPNNPSSSLEKWVGQVQTIVRQVIAIDKRSQEIIAVVILEGDINSVQSDAVAFHSYFSNKYPGSTIKVVAIQKGSIRLIIKGSTKDIQKLLSDFEAENITQINGFPVQDIQILSESSEDDESSEQKWRLVEEIITNPIEGRDLSGADLSDADLRNASLINANLSDADLSDANLRDADLRDADLSGADLSDANLIGADLIGADLSGANLIFANLSGANLSDAHLSDAHLSGVNLSRADLSGADLSGANLSGANLSRADLSGADLSGANLIFANLIFADLSGANLIDADLSGADLSGADLSGADLSSAHLSGADLSDANLSDANLISANVENARFSENQGISEEMKQDLIKRGAIFADSPGDRSFVRV